MKRVHFILLPLILLLSGMASGLCPERPVFAIRPEMKKYLRYFFIENEFDTAVVRYELGEIRIKTGGTLKMLPPDSLFDESKPVPGSVQNGTDRKLMQLCRTGNFIMPEKGEILFFRKLAVNVKYSKKDSEQAPKSIESKNPLDTWWQGAPGRLKAGSEFVLYLVRSSDNSVLAVIDSVGVPANPSSWIAARYGTDPDFMNHSRPITTGFAGTECYFRLSPRIYGSEGQELTLSMLKYPSNLSFFQEYGIGGINKANDDCLEEYDSLFIAEYLDYCDSIKKATGLLPKSDMLFYSEKLNDILHQRYYELVSVSEWNDSSWKERIDPAFKGIEIPEGYLLYFDKPGLAKIFYVNTRFVDAGYIELKMQTFRDFNNVSLTVISSDGKKIKQIELGKIERDTKIYKIFLDPGLKGKFELVAEDSQVGRLAVKEFKL